MQLWAISREGGWQLGGPDYMELTIKGQNAPP